MGRLTEGWRGLFLLVLFSFSSAGAVGSADSGTGLQHAQTYYWLGLGNGDPGAFRRGLEYLDQETGSPDEQANAVIQAFMAELSAQKEIADATLVGILPLTRFMGAPVFINPASHPSFVVDDDPLEVAAGRLAAQLGSVITQSQFNDLQLPVVVVAGSDTPPILAAKVRAGLKKYYRAKVYEPLYLSNTLSAEDIAAVNAGTLDSRIAGQILDYLMVPNLLVTRVKLVDHVDDVYFLKQETEVFLRHGTERSSLVTHYEVLRDRRMVLAKYFVTGILFGLISLVLFLLVFKARFQKLPELRQILVGPLLALICGFIVGALVATLLESFRPPLTGYFASGAWWVGLYFPLVAFASITGYRVLIKRVPFLQELLDFSGKRGILFACAGVGAAIYSMFGLFVYHEAHLLVPGVTLMVLMLGATGYLLGAAMDGANRYPAWKAALALLLLVPAGLAVAGAEGHWLLGGVTAYLLLLAVPGKRSPQAHQDQALTCIESDRKRSIPASANELHHRLLNPPLVHSGAIESLWTSLQGSTVNSLVQVRCLIGPAGIGKTTAARAVIHKIEAGKGNGPLLKVLEARCSADASASPFAAIRSLLADGFNVNPMGDSDRQIREIDAVLDGVFNRIVPFASILFPGGGEQVASAHSRDELFSSILVALRQLCQRQPILIFVDDLHWLDKPSIELLGYLISSVKETPHGLWFLFTSRHPPDVSLGVAEDDCHAMLALTSEERRQLLVDELGFEEQTAEQIIGFTSSAREGAGDLFWLLRVIENLVQADGLDYNSDGVTLKPEYRGKSGLPVPDEYRTSIEQALKENRPHIHVLGAAAASGTEFSVDILADALNMDRLLVLEALGELEERTGLIMDITSRDGVFSFSSTFAWEAVRDILGIRNEGPCSHTVRQLVREYHARIGRSLARKAGESQVTEIARHYYSAGSEYCDRAVDWCLRAARYSARVFQFDQSRQYLAMADECVSAGASVNDFEERKLIVECEITHVEGRGAVELAERCCKYIEERHDVSIPARLAFARACYEARKFHQCSEIAQSVIGECPTLLEKVEAMHFHAIAQPLDQTQRRVQLLELALNELKEGGESNDAVRKLQATLLNSLGEDLSRKAIKQPECKETARDAYLHSIDIKQSFAVPDLPGLARSYGGIGRLELYVEPVDHEMARKYLEEDLTVARRIHDHSGQAQMHSLLGEIALQSGDAQSAAEHYLQSAENADRPLDRFFASLGLLRVGTQAVSAESLSEALTNLERQVMGNEIGTGLIQKLRETLEKSDLNDGVDRLTSLCDGKLIEAQALEIKE